MQVSASSGPIRAAIARVSAPVPAPTSRIARAGFVDRAIGAVSVRARLVLLDAIAPVVRRSRPASATNNAWPRARVDRNLWEIVCTHSPCRLTPCVTSAGRPAEAPTKVGGGRTPNDAPIRYWRVSLRGYSRDVITVLVVDDDQYVRRGLTGLLDTDDELSAIAEASDGREAVRFVESHDVDVVLMDVRMPTMDGIEATRRIVALPSRPRILALTTFDLDRYVYSALAAGADGFLLKDSPPAEILRAIRVVADGGSMLHPNAARALIDRFHEQTSESAHRAVENVDRLTPREVQVLELVGRGDSNAEIAAALSMRVSTVKAHVSRILTALGVSNRVQAALVARDAQLFGRIG